MDSVKKNQQIKSIKKLLQEKQFEGALEHCETILRTDPTDYYALVFKGFACQETCKPKEARDSLLKAAEVDPENLVAWKGLSVFYEKYESPDNNLKLIKVYQTLENLLKSDKPKQMEVINKLITLSKSVGMANETVAAMCLKAKVFNESEDLRGEFCAWTSLIDFVLSLDENNGYLEELNEAFQRAMICSSSARASQHDIAKLQKEYLLHLKQRNGIPEVLVNVRNIIADMEEDSYPLEFICQLFCDSLITELDTSNMFDVVEIENMALLLQERAADFGKYLAKMTLGAVALKKNQTLVGLPLINESLVGSVKLITAWPLLAEAHLLLHNYKEAEKVAMTGLKSLAQFQSNEKKHELLSVIRALLCVWLSWALVGLRRLEDAQNTLKKCHTLLNGIKSSDLHKTRRLVLELKECEARIALKNLEFDVALKLGEELKSDRPFLPSLFEAIIAMEERNFVDAEKFINVSLDVKETAEGLHLLSVIQWKLGKNKTEALQNMLKACKADPFLAQNYLYLGHFYGFQCNQTRAEHCYMKAYQLDPFDAEIAYCLSDFLYEYNLDNAIQIKVLKSITRNQKSLHWAWRRLGLCYLQMGSRNVAEAIVSFQNAIRLIADASQCWECLGDAYLLQGSYGASLKAFERVIEIDGFSVYSSYQVAKIKHLLGLHKDALAEYEAILSQESNYIGAIEGVIKCKLSLASKYRSQSLLGLAKDEAIEALTLLNKKIFPDQNVMSCFCKLGGDLCTILASLGSQILPLHANLKLHGVTKSSPYGENEFLSSANWCFGRAVALNPSSSALWHDLGISYYHLFRLYETQSELTPDSASKAARSLDKSLACLREALRLSPNDPRHWLTLGTVAANSNSNTSNAALAQHCLVKALQLDPNCVTAWANLGLLYLKRDELTLAHQAFQKGQSVEPACPNPWVCQALVAEKVQDDEALDLFRHSTLLGNNPESLLGYGYQMCSSLLSHQNESTEMMNIKNWKTLEQGRKIIQASDSLIKYTALNTNNAFAYCYLSLLMERRGLLSSALDAARRALDLACNEKAFTELDILKANLARLLRKTGFCQEAVTIYSSVEHTDVSVHCETALAHLGNGNPEMAYQSYKQAYGDCTKSCPELQSHILTAMAFVARRIPNVEMKDVKTLLFKSLQCKPQSVPGLLGLVALGFFENDTNLTNAALAELENYKFDHQYWPQIANLLAINKAKIGDTKGAVRIFCNAVHWQPSSSLLWSKTAMFLLLSDAKNADVAAKCAIIADVHKDLLIESTKPSHKLVSALCYLASGKIKFFRQLVLSVVHTDPEDVQAWSCLALSNLLKYKSLGAFFGVFKIIRKLISIQNLGQGADRQDTEVLEEWLTATEAYGILLHLKSNGNLLTDFLKDKKFEQKRYVDKVEYLTDLHSTSNLDAPLSNLSQILHNEVALAHQNILWMSLIKGRMLQKRFDEAEKELNNWMENLEASKASEFSKLIPLLLLALVAKEAQQLTPDSEKSWVSVGQAAVTMALKISPQCYATHFIASLLAIQKGSKEDVKFAQRSLERCLYGQACESEELKSINVFTRELLLNLYVEKSDDEAIKKLLQNSILTEDAATVAKIRNLDTDD